MTTSAQLFKSALLGLFVAASSPASATVFRYYNEGNATLVRDGLGLFGPATNAPRFDRVGFTRTILEFDLPAWEWGDPLELPLDDGYLRIRMWDRTVDTHFSSGTLLMSFERGAFDRVQAPIDATAGRDGTVDLSFRHGPYESASYWSPWFFGSLRVFEPSSGLETSLYIWESTRAAWRTIEDPPAATAGAIAQAVPIPAPGTGWLAPLALLLALFARGRTRPPRMAPAGPARKVAKARPRLRVGTCALAMCLAGPAAATPYQLDMAGMAALEYDDLGTFGAPSTESRDAYAWVRLVFDVPARASLPPGQDYPISNARVRVTMFGQSAEATLVDAALALDPLSNAFSLGGPLVDGPSGTDWGYLIVAGYPGPLSRWDYPDPLDYPDAQGQALFALRDDDRGLATRFWLYSFPRNAILTALPEAAELPEPPTWGLLLAALGVMPVLRRRGGNQGGGGNAAICRS